MRLAGISKSFGETRVLDRFDAAFPERGVVGVSGASGSGKTTLLRILAGLESPDDGRLEGVPPRRSVQFEDDRLFPWMDVHANVAIVGCEASRVSALLDELHLADKEHARVGDLSGGQRRRVSLARALAFDAGLYLLDEPTARLDAQSAEIVLQAIERHCGDALVVAASHDERLLERCDAVIAVSQ